jgi:hypothetical protein
MTFEESARDQVLAGLASVRLPSWRTTRKQFSVRRGESSRHRFTDCGEDITTPGRTTEFDQGPNNWSLKRETRDTTRDREEQRERE